MAKFDEKQLRARLDAVDPQRRVAFAAACVERLGRVFAEFSREYRLSRYDALMREMRDAFWTAAEGAPAEVGGKVELEAELGAMYDDVYDIGDGMEPFGYGGSMMDACSAAMEAGAGGGPAAGVARWVHEAVFEYVSEHLGSVMAAAHPLVQAEVQRQERDFTELESGRALEDIVRELKARALNDSEVFFGEDWETPPS